jgi:FkbM family methyltransferase
MFFLSLLPDDGLVIDIGANLGVMTYYLAKDKPNRRVFSFEPIPYNFNNLEKIVRKFNLKNVYVFNCALGEKDGEIEMVLPVQKAVRFHGLAHVKMESAGLKNQGEFFKCPMYRLDGLPAIKDENKKLAGIKIDVENYEYNVLKGAEALLRKDHPPVYCELWENENRFYTIEFLTGLGYKTWVLENSNLVPFAPGVHKTQNFFFIK